MANKSVIFQYFEWYSNSEGNHWKQLAEDAPHLASLGISHVWMPPVFKATGTNDVGYGVYDLYDLGEFDQKGTIRTKYGTKEDYLAAIQALKNQGIKPVADIVLNHKAGADETESFQAYEVARDNRQQVISEPMEIEGWTKFTYPGRKGAYSDFVWHWYHFSGVDYDNRRQQNGIYMVMGDNKGWAANEQVDTENGNYDYLMYADVDYRHPEVVAETKKWAQWYLEETGVEGFRLDAIKHIQYDFIKDLIKEVVAYKGNDFYVFGEYWKPDYEDNERYLQDINFEFDLVDVVLHMNLYQAGLAGANYDLRQILDNTLMQKNPTAAVTFVDNHDSQPTQALESFVADWFKPAAYGLILLRNEGLPTIFYGDYYGIAGDHPIVGHQWVLDHLLHLRQEFADSNQEDYWDHPNCIGWVRRVIGEHAKACVVLISNSDFQEKRMYVGQELAGQMFIDILELTSDQITIEADGWATFPIQQSGLSVWVGTR